MLRSGRSLQLAKFSENYNVGALFSVSAGLYDGFFKKSHLFMNEKRKKQILANVVYYFIMLLERLKRAF